MLNYQRVIIDNCPIHKWPWPTIPRECLQVVKALLMSGASVWRVDSRGWTLGAPGWRFPAPLALVSDLNAEFSVQFFLIGS
jgi:hypothetical protein